MSAVWEYLDHQTRNFALFLANIRSSFVWGSCDNKFAVFALHVAIKASLVRNEGSTWNLYQSLLNPFKNRVPKPSDAFRSVRNIFFSRSGATLTGNRYQTNKTKYC